MKIANIAIKYNYGCNNKDFEKSNNFSNPNFGLNLKQAGKMAEKTVRNAEKISEKMPAFTRFLFKSIDWMKKKLFDDNNDATEEKQEKISTDNISKTISIIQDRNIIDEINKIVKRSKLIVENNEKYYENHKNGTKYRIYLDEFNNDQYFMQMAKDGSYGKYDTSGELIERKLVNPDKSTVLEKFSNYKYTENGITRDAETINSSIYLTSKNDIKKKSVKYSSVQTLNEQGQVIDESGTIDLFKQPNTQITENDENLKINLGFKKAILKNGEPALILTDGEGNLLFPKFEKPIIEPQGEISSISGIYHDSEIIKKMEDIFSVRRNAKFDRKTKEKLWYYYNDDKGNTYIKYLQYSAKREEEPREYEIKDANGNYKLYDLEGNLIEEGIKTDTTNIAGTYGDYKTDKNTGCISRNIVTDRSNVKILNTANELVEGDLIIISAEQLLDANGKVLAEQGVAYAEDDKEYRYETLLMNDNTVVYRLYKDEETKELPDFQCLSETAIK